MQITLEENQVIVEKSLLNESSARSQRPVPYRENWVHGESLHQRILTLAQAEQAELADIFQPARSWVAQLRELADEQDKLPGQYVDAIWQNAMLDAEGQMTFIDLEWHAVDPVPVRLLLLRGIYRFLVDLREQELLARCLRQRSTRALLNQVSTLLGEFVSEADMEALIELESRLRSTASGQSTAQSRQHINRVLRLPQRSGTWARHASFAQEAFVIYRDKVVRLVHRTLGKTGT